MSIRFLSNKNNDTKNIPVKLFTSIEEMNRSTGNKEGDLALVYASKISNWQVDTQSNVIVFPDTVVLPEKFSGQEATFTSIEGSAQYVSFTASSWNGFRLSLYLDGHDIRVTYSTEDNITYTKQEGDSIIILPSIVKYSGLASYWSGVIGYFMQVNSITFEGIYEYKGDKWNTALSNIDATKEYVYSKTYYGKDGMNSGTLGADISLLMNDVNATLFYRLQDVYTKSENAVKIEDNWKVPSTLRFIPTKPDGTSLWDTSSVTNMKTMFRYCSDLQTVPTLDTSSVTDMSSMFYECRNLETVSLSDTSQAVDMSNMFYGCKKLKTISELDMSSATNLSRIFDGCSMLTEISLKNTNKVTNMSGLFSGCTNLQTVPDLDMSSVNKVSSMFYGCSSLKTIPDLNTSQVTDMSSLFLSCSNLQTVPELNTDLVTIFDRTFSGCESLTEIPSLNTSAATITFGMFSGCILLETIPMLDTSHVTDMTNMFYGCTNLQTVPELDTSSATKMNRMFSGCTNLQTVPELNASSVTDMLYIFEKCPNLSEESLNNILKMCISVSSSGYDTKSHKELEYMGLTREQADICKTLSNWDAFVAAGWTTGY